MAIGKKIKALRELLGWSQLRLGETAGVSQATLSAIEKRDSARSIYLVPIARAVSVALEDLRDLPLDDLKAQIEGRTKPGPASPTAAVAQPHVSPEGRDAHVLRLFHELHPAQQAQFVTDLENTVTSNRAIAEHYRAPAATRPRHR